jgi:hypothetical protein
MVDCALVIYLTGLLFTWLVIYMACYLPGLLITWFVICWPVYLACSRLALRDMYKILDGNMTQVELLPDPDPSPQHLTTLPPDLCQNAALQMWDSNQKNGPVQRTCEKMRRQKQSLLLRDLQMQVQVHGLKISHTVRHSGSATIYLFFCRLV